MKKLSKLLQGLLYLLPLALVFSYHPVILLGVNETMNFELSVALLWLVVFDVVGVVALVMTMACEGWGLLKRWKRLAWLMSLPVFATVSLVWTANLTRGILTVGVMWLVVIAVVIMVVFREWFAELKFRRNFWRWFFGATIFVCAWCVLQCVLDVVGVTREYSLLCLGCTSWSFGFPHPNGFAVEPQFMGNLLLAPIMVSVSFLVGPHPLKMILLNLFVFVATLFLVFSRGAIYAFIVGMVFMSAMLMVVWRKKLKLILKRIVAVWGIIVLAFVFTLNLQGIMAQVGPTNDTYVDGVAKVLNQLSLGIIDIRGKGIADNANGVGDGVVEKPVENFEDGMEEQTVDSAVSEGDVADVNNVDANKEAIFDGYVEESTEIRKMMTRNALKVWSRDARTIFLGVGIGGAGEAMYEAGATDWPKEIVQNEYANILLELGIVGVVLMLVVAVMVVRAFLKSAVAPILLTLMVAYGVTLVFFSGMVNALQIYLLPVAIWAILMKEKTVSV